jgi:hypothetical protein
VPLTTRKGDDDDQLALTRIPTGLVIYKSSSNKKSEISYGRIVLFGEPLIMIACMFTKIPPSIKQIPNMVIIY